MINNKPLFVFTVLTATMLIWLSDEISMKLSLIALALALALGFLFIIWPLSIKIRIANEEDKAQKFKDNERHYVSLQNKLGAINISSQIQEDGLLELVDLLTNPNQEELKKQKDELLQQAAQNFKKSRKRLSEISKISLNFVSSKITSTELHFLIEALEGKVVLDSSSIRLLEEKNNLKLDLKDSAFTAITDVANSIDGECSIKVREVRLNNFKDIFNPILFRKAIKITISGNISKGPEFTHAKRFVELHHFGKFEIKDSMSETFGEVSITLPIKTVTTNSVSSLENTLLPVYKKAGNFSYIFGISLIFLIVIPDWKGDIRTGFSTDLFKTTEELQDINAFDEKDTQMDIDFLMNQITLREQLESLEVDKETVQQITPETLLKIMGVGIGADQAFKGYKKQREKMQNNSQPKCNKVKWKKIWKFPIPSCT